MRVRLCALLLAIAAACGDSDRAVPFKRPDDPSKTEPATGPATGPATENAGTEDGTLPRDGLLYQAPVARVELGELPFEHPQTAVIAALDVDLDADGDRDLLLVTRPQDPDQGPAELQRVERRDDGWGAPVAVVELDDGRCHLDAARLSRLQGPYASAHLKLGCNVPEAQAASTEAATVGDSPLDEPPPLPEDERPPPQAPFERTLLLSVERAPRVLFTLGQPTDPGGTRVDASLQPRDLDGDEHLDVMLALRVHPGGEREPVAVELPMLNRPGGLARATEQPEQALRPIANAAKQARKATPAKARAAAERVLAVHRALCREGGQARIEIDGSPGLPCGPSLAAGRAASVLAAVAAHEGKLLEAIELAEGLGAPHYRLTDNDRARVRYAFEAVTDGDVTWRRGPRLPPASAPPIHHPAIAFMGEGKLLLRGEPAQTLPLSGPAPGAPEPTAVGAPLAMESPDGTMVATEIVRSCDGYHVRLVAAAQVIAGVVAGKALAEPLVAAAAPPPGAQCPEPLPAAETRDDGGLRALGWTAEGLLFARGVELSLLSLGPDGSAAAPARVLAADEAPPRLHYPSLITTDGSTVLLRTSRGLAALRRDRSGGRLTPPPPGDGALGDVAVSPSGRGLAAVRDATIWYAVPDSASATAPAAQVPAATAAPGREAPAPGPQDPPAPGGAAPQDPPAPDEG